MAPVQPSSQPGRTFQKTVSKSVPWNFSGIPEVESLGPRRVTNSSKSTWPSPGAGRVPVSWEATPGHCGPVRDPGSPLLGASHARLWADAEAPKCAEAPPDRCVCGGGGCSRRALSGLARGRHVSPRTLLPGAGVGPNILPTTHRKQSSGWGTTGPGGHVLSVWRGDVGGARVDWEERTGPSWCLRIFPSLKARWHIQLMILFSFW